MAIKTLDELNRDFVAQRDSHYTSRAAQYEPITPLEIRVFPPQLPKTPSGSAASHANRTESGRTSRGESGNTSRTKSGFSNRTEPLAEETAAGRYKQRTHKSSRGVFAFISNMVFYMAIVLIMVTVLTSGTENGTPKTIFGYSYFTVVSKSMQDEIPKGSFILVKHGDAKDLKVGDTITYMRDRNTSVTHKIIDIYENYNKSGALGFQTKGVNNLNPDSDVVYEANIVGKVIISIPVMGAVMSFLASNVYLVFIIFGLCVIMSFCLRGLFVRPSNRKVREAG